MTTTLNIITAYKEIISLLLQIEQAQINIDEAAPYLDESRQHLSYFEAVKPHYEKILDENISRRYELSDKFRELAWKTFNMELPVFVTSDTGIPF